MEESEESFQARLRQAREERELAEERRRREAADRRVEQEKERAKGTAYDYQWSWM